MRMGGGREVIAFTDSETVAVGTELGLGVRACVLV